MPWIQLQGESLQLRKQLGGNIFGQHLLFVKSRVVARGRNGGRPPPFLTSVLFDVVFKTTRIP